MPRIEVRTFLKNSETRETEAREVDLESPNARFPVGTVITCDEGHEVCTVVNALHKHQKVRVEDFGDWREGQRVPIELPANPTDADWAAARLGPCWCGAEYAKADGLIGRLYVKDKGWT